MKHQNVAEESQAADTPVRNNIVAGDIAAEYMLVEDTAVDNIAVREQVVVHRFAGYTEENTERNKVVGNTADCRPEMNSELRIA